MYIPYYVQKSYFGYVLHMTQSFKLRAGFSAEGSGWYNSAFYNGTVKVGGIGVLNLSVKKSWEITAEVYCCPLWTCRIYDGTIAEDAFSIRNHVSSHTEPSLLPIFRFTYTKPFGRQRGVAHENRLPNQKEELNRLKIE